MKVDIKTKEKTISIRTKERNILTTLTKHSLFISAYCGGKGVCGKCKIRYLSTPPPALGKELSVFSKEELENGFRLACLHEFNPNDKIEIFETEPIFSEGSKEVCVDKNADYIAIDIGTTTISLSLIKNGMQKQTINLLNPQVSFGGDVLTRIAYSNNDKTNTLFKILNTSIQKAVDAVLRFNKFENVEEIVVSANPTMLSFFLNLDPKSIGEYPYTPPFTGSKSTKWGKVNVYIPPVISAFIGSDITSGLINLDFNNNFLFVDIGTNCEFILKYEDNIYAASVPGGPALEGAGIDYGITAQAGAIDKVIFDKTFKCHTLQNKKAKGIAGSGLISAIALLNKYKIIDKTGKIKQPWEIEDIPLPLLNRIKKEGFLLENGIYLTQNSIREFQLVKGALNAGFDILMKKTTGTIDNIDKIYISGGFTKSLTKEDVICSNLLDADKEFIFLGNSALNGAMKLFCKKNRDLIEDVSKKIKYIEIANEDDFQQLYIKYMDFS